MLGPTSDAAADCKSHCAPHAGAVLDAHRAAVCGTYVGGAILISVVASVSVPVEPTVERADGGGNHRERRRRFTWRRR